MLTKVSKCLKLLLNYLQLPKFKKINYILRKVYPMEKSSLADGHYHFLLVQHNILMFIQFTVCFKLAMKFLPNFYILLHVFKVKYFASIKGG